MNLGSLANRIDAAQCPGANRDEERMIKEKYRSLNLKQFGIYQRPVIFSEIIRANTQMAMEWTNIREMGEAATRICQVNEQVFSYGENNLAVSESTSDITND
jgi:hypothetical protein